MHDRSTDGRPLSVIGKRHASIAACQRSIFSERSSCRRRRGSIIRPRSKPAALAADELLADAMAVIGDEHSGQLLAAYDAEDATFLPSDARY